MNCTNARRSFSPARNEPDIIAVGRESATPIKGHASRPVAHLVKRVHFFSAFIPVGSVGYSEQDLHHGPAGLAGLGCAEALTEVW
jgi:hypothetical protein